MRVYTKVVFDMTRDDCPIVSEEWFEYVGEWAKCDGDSVGDVIGGVAEFSGLPTPNPIISALISPFSDPTTRDVLTRPFVGPGDFDDITPPGGGEGAPPPPSDIELSREQLELALQPFLLEQEGLRLVGGQIQRIPFGELRPEQQRGQQIFENLQTRQLSALRGELEVDPALENQLQREEQALIIDISRNQGLQSGSGQARLEQFRRRADASRLAARQGQVSVGEQQLLARTGAEQGQQFNVLEQLRSALQQGRAFRSDIFSTQADIFGTQVGARTALDVAEKQRQAAIIGGLVGGAGRVGGAFAGAA